MKNGINKGMLITFESGECGGKDTQIALLSDYFRSKGLSVYDELWEPGCTLKSEVIRILLKNKYDSDFQFPGDFIQTFDLGEYRRDFAAESIPPLATQYITNAMARLKSGMKYETLYFLLNNRFFPNGDLEFTINVLNKEINEINSGVQEKERGTPAEWLLSEYYSKDVLSAEVQMYLYMADRNILHHNLVKQALDEYDAVIINRSRDSGTVYQGHAQNPSLKEGIRAMNLEATEGIIPDMTVLLDLPVEEIAERKAARLGTAKYSGRTVDFFDSKKVEFHQKIREGYLEEAKYYKSLPIDHPEHGRIVVIDGKGNVERVHKRICAKVDSYLKHLYK